MNKKDFYLYAGNIVQNFLNESSNKNIKNFKITRDVIKKIVMTIAYNITVVGVVEQLKERFKLTKIINKQLYVVSKDNSKDGDTIYLTEENIRLLGKLIHKALINNLPSSLKCFLSAINWYTLYQSSKSFRLAVNKG